MFVSVPKSPEPVNACDGNNENPADGECNVFLLHNDNDLFLVTRWLNAFTLTSRQEHVAIVAIETTEGLLVVRVLEGHMIWQETAEIKTTTIVEEAKVL